MVGKKYSLLFYIELLLVTIPLLNFKIFCQNLKPHIQTSKLKILLQYFLQVILMHTLSFGGLMATNPEGTKIEELFSQLGLSQLISEPTNFEPQKNPSCIDLVVTDQPNIILDCGTRTSLDSHCHHQIVHCKVNFRIPPPLPFERKIWHFNRANSAAIKRSMTNFPWRQHLNGSVLKPMTSVGRKSIRLYIYIYIYTSELHIRGTEHNLHIRGTLIFSHTLDILHFFFVGALL